jgi:hypothetical protein
MISPKLGLVEYDSDSERNTSIHTRHRKRKEELCMGLVI